MCAHRVGDESLRGVSGGERKRVTTAEVLCGPACVLCMDEVSTGLDSCKCICDMCVYARSLLECMLHNVAYIDVYS